MKPFAKFVPMTRADVARLASAGCIQESDLHEGRNAVFGMSDDSGYIDHTLAGDTTPDIAKD